MVHCSTFGCICLNSASRPCGHTEWHCDQILEKRRSVHSSWLLFADYCGNKGPSCTNSKEKWRVSGVTWDRNWAGIAGCCERTQNPSLSNTAKYSHMSSLHFKYCSCQSPADSDREYALASDCEHSYLQKASRRSSLCSAYMFRSSVRLSWNVHYTCRKAQECAPKHGVLLVWRLPPPCNSFVWCWARRLIHPSWFWCC